jgi:hypothetical protein
MSELATVGSTVSVDAETVALMMVMLPASCANLGTDASLSGTELAAVAAVTVKSS